MTDPTTTVPGIDPPAHDDASPAPTAVHHHIRRRPTGAPPALPRHLGATGKAWLVLLILLLIWVPAALAFDQVLRVADVADSWFLRGAARFRTPWLTTIVSGANRVGSRWGPTIVAVAMLIVLVGFRRWRHLFTLLGTLVVLTLVAGRLYQEIARPRPFDVTTIGRWNGFSMPSPPVAILSAILVGVTYTLVVPGRPRTWAKWVIGVMIAGFVASRLYLAVDRPSDAILGVTLGVAIPLVGFRLFTPNETFPVAYRRGKTAHLDVSGRRGEAIRRAVQDQLGLTVLSVKPVGLAGSGGSTPLRLKVAGDPETYLFAKLYAMNHVRADRWYKLGRLLLYGRLEDEAAFQTVRRLVEYEDYTARLFQDVGIPTAASYGIVELTPDREYLLVTEFLDGAVEIGEAEVDDRVIDQGLAIVRRLWDGGLAHRDIKPANMLVRDGTLYLIDVAFVQVRPSPWRQAVDLANMMLVLAVRTDAQRVHARALAFFSPFDIAEAFAAARGIASPSQLRAVMKQDGRNLVEQFRELSPRRRPIPLQRWSVRRVLLALGLVVGTVLAVAQIATLIRPADDLTVSASPDCGTGNLMILVAQSVPSATSLPCIAALPAGWELGHVEVRRGRTRFSLESSDENSVDVALAPEDACRVSDASRVPSDEVGKRRYERPEQLAPRLLTTQIYLFAGGCVTYAFDFAADAPRSAFFDVGQALSFVPRSDLADEVHDRTGLRLCGAGQDCPGGS